MQAFYLVLKIQNIYDIVKLYYYDESMPFCGQGEPYMRILFINAVCGTGSTGRICTDLAGEYEKAGHQVKIAYGRHAFVPEQHKKYAVRIGSDLDVKLHALYTRITDRTGFWSRAATKKFLAWAEEFDPDVLWLHNIHGYYIHIGFLFQWIKSRPNMQVKWTLHDCWTFTGHCAYFDFAGCQKWKTGCHACPQKGAYPASSGLDSSRWNYETKRKLFTGVPNMTLITPSQWLADRVKNSFLKDYPVEVCYNTIDTSIFKPTPSDFRARYGLEDKRTILGVASTWEKRKGLEDFVQLAGMLDDRYRIVLVGLSPEQAQAMPANVISIPRTNSAKELAEIYTAADLFVNPSYEETFGLTTLEASSCGTPGIVYAGTACEEVVNLYGGIAVTPGAKSLYTAICSQL